MVKKMMENAYSIVLPTCIIFLFSFILLNQRCQSNDVTDSSNSSELFFHIGNKCLPFTSMRFKPYFEIWYAIVRPGYSVLQFKEEN